MMQTFSHPTRPAGLILALTALLLLAAPVGEAVSQKNGGRNDSGRSGSGQAGGIRRVDGLLTVNFEQVELPVLIKFISDVTGRNFVFTDKVGGNVTLVSPTPVSVDEAYALFQSVLTVRGLTTIDDGIVTRIVPVREARTQGSGVSLTDGSGFMTKMLPLRHVAADEMASVLVSLVSKDGSLVPYRATNTIIVSDTSQNIARITSLVRSMDVAGHEESVEVVRLEHADATRVADQIVEILATSRSPRAGGKDKAPDHIGFKVVPDERTNSLIAVATAIELRKIRSLARSLDTPLQPGDQRIHVYYARHADAEAMVRVVSGMLGQRGRRSTSKGESMSASGTSQGLTDQLSITSDPATNAVIINASTQDQATVLELLQRLDIPRPQVFIEAIIVEASMDKSRALGFEFQTGDAFDSGVGVIRSNLTNLNSALINPANLSGLVLAASSNRLVTLPDGTQVAASAALFNALAQNTDIEVLSAPTLLTLDNQEAEIIVGENVPFVTGRAADLAAVENVFTTVERRDVGIKLKVKPQVSEGNQVILSVEQEVSALVESPGDIDQIVGPRTTKRSASTTVSVLDGRTVVIGGLISDTARKVNSKIPLLGDIPGIGRLFQHQRKAEDKVNLIVFLTPHVIRNPLDLQQVSDSRREDYRRALDQPVRALPGDYGTGGQTQGATAIPRPGTVAPAASTYVTPSAPAAALPPSVEPPLPQERLVPEETIREPGATEQRRRGPGPRGGRPSATNRGPGDIPGISTSGAVPAAVRWQQDPVAAAPSAEEIELVGSSAVTSQPRIARDPILEEALKAARAILGSPAGYGSGYRALPANAAVAANQLAVAVEASPREPAYQTSPTSSSGRTVAAGRHSVSAPGTVRADVSGRTETVAWVNRQKQRASGRTASPRTITPAADSVLALSRSAPGSAAARPAPVRRASAQIAFQPDASVVAEAGATPTDTSTTADAAATASVQAPAPTQAAPAAGFGSAWAIGISPAATAIERAAHLVRSARRYSREDLDILAMRQRGSEYDFALEGLTVGPRVAATKPAEIIVSTDEISRLPAGE